ncbi:ATP-dependent helicase HrpB [Kineosporia mesophila]|uniref:ATP-dependent helicase HrpB n=1 Tax=Kineosporia mesophila TaxID=566012 RepID=A0ABP6ZKR4_9ACTN|nr:ATP-dependent helicase HrpB [Kineosporia mesophila]MCD5349568.1 ATP-dependent helicase HrpB [Kineosporia mesophila]
MLLATAERALGSALPISSTIPTLLAALTSAGAGVLVSPPGTGKTTLVPLALADAVEGRVVVAEPRRVAARAAARRMAWLLGEEVGDRVGYSVRGERRVGRRTRVEVVTTGLLVRRLLSDAELPGTAVVLLDECHERHLDTDLALAFSAEVRSALRPDLWLLAASATADSDRMAALLGNAPVIGADAPLFSVNPVWCPPTGPVDPPHGLRVDPRLLDHVASVVRRALAETTGDVLVFLPGAGEIEGVARRLSSVGAEVLRLHGRLSGRDQDAVLTGGRSRRRVVLSTSVAESSLTVPGVRCVVDAGLARVPRTDLSRGLSGLATVRVSSSSAHQRAGRAGREAPGVVYRCWSQAEHDRLPAHPAPEVDVADLTGFALSLAVWGSPDPATLPLPSQPPASAMAVARQTLQALGAVSDDGRVTDRGTRLTTAGVHPRLARALLDGAARVGARRSSEIVALLADDSLGGGTDDLAAAWRRLRNAGAGDPLAARWRDEVRRLRSAIPEGPVRDQADVPGDDLAAGLVTGLAFPERIARLRRTGGYLMSGGTGAGLSPGSGLTGISWLAVAVAQRQAGAQAARVRLAAAIDETTALEAGGEMLRTVDEVVWSGGDVVARQRDLLGSIVLSERPLKNPATPLVQEALRAGMEKEGLGLLRWTPAALHLRARLALLHRALDWPDVSDAALLERAQEWLLSARRRSDLQRVDLVQALRGLLDHRERAQLDALAPERIVVPSSSNIALTYSDDLTDPADPVLAVRLQEVFGWAAAPRIADGRVPVVLHLLSPAGRALAVTSDLESFWQNAYPGVRSEMRGRYPKHPWPDDPASAVPTKRTKHPARR